MPLDLSNTLVIGISATALFDMSESDRMFRETYATDPDREVPRLHARTRKPAFTARNRLPLSQSVAGSEPAPPAG